MISADPEADGTIVVDRESILNSMQQKSPRYDKDGEEHYNTISAMIKSIRGSDPDAGIFYLAKALDAGETPEFLSRRLIILAAEDVGMANPQALSLAVAADQAVRTIGLPSAHHPRRMRRDAATSPKSNASYMAINKAGRS